MITSVKLVINLQCFICYCWVTGRRTGYSRGPCHCHCRVPTSSPVVRLQVENITPALDPHYHLSYHCQRYDHLSHNPICPYYDPWPYSEPWAPSPDTPGPPLIPPHRCTSLLPISQYIPSILNRGCCSQTLTTTHIAAPDIIFYLELVSEDACRGARKYCIIGEETRRVKYEIEMTRVAVFTMCKTANPFH